MQGRIQDFLKGGGGENFYHYEIHRKFDPSEIGVKGHDVNGHQSVLRSHSTAIVYCNFSSVEESGLGCILFAVNVIHLLLYAWRHLKNDYVVRVIHCHCCSK